MSKVFQKITIFFIIAIWIILIIFTIFLLEFPKKYYNYVNEYASVYNLDKNLIFAVIKTESNFDEKAVSKSGAIGLMQIMPSTAEFIAKKLNRENFKTDDLYSPKTNIEFGVFYLKYLLNKFDDLEALCAYNAGETVVLNWLNSEDYSLEQNKLNKIPYKETEWYVKKVNISKNIYSFRLKLFI